MYKTTAWQGSPHPLKTINAPCETMSCQTRTKDPNLQTDSKFTVGDGVGSPLTEQPHCYVSGEKGALNQPGAGWVSQVHSQVNILSHFRILAPRSDIIHSIWFGNRSENLCCSSTLTKPHTFCGIHHYYHLSDLVEITCFYGLNETVLLLVEMLLWMNSGWRKSSRIWCLHWTGWSSVPTGPSKDFNLRMKSITTRTSQEWTSQVLARTQGCGEGVQLRFQWQLQLEYAAPALHSL